VRIDEPRKKHASVGFDKLCPIQNMRGCIFDDLRDFPPLDVNRAGGKPTELAIRNQNPVQSTALLAKAADSLSDRDRASVWKSSGESTSNISPR
jgi:hypothetical protein